MKSEWLRRRPRGLGYICLIAQFTTSAHITPGKAINFQVYYRHMYNRHFV
jgi:hypothetical protein